MYLMGTKHILIIMMFVPFGEKMMVTTKGSFQLLELALSSCSSYLLSRLQSNLSLLITTLQVFTGSYDWSVLVSPFSQFLVNLILIGNLHLHIQTISSDIFDFSSIWAYHLNTFILFYGHYQVMEPNDGWSLHASTTDARPFESSSLAIQRVFIIRGNHLRSLIQNERLLGIYGGQEVKPACQDLDRILLFPP